MAQLFTLAASRDDDDDEGRSASVQARRAEEAARKAKQTRKATVGVQFGKELDVLVKLIGSTTAHFVRCIKPNSDKSAGGWESNLVLEQLRYSGVFDVVKIRKMGYPFRMAHAMMIGRYRCLLEEKERAKIVVGKKATKDSNRAGCAQLLKALPASPRLTVKADGPNASWEADVRVGSTRVFYRPAQNRALEGSREIIVDRLIRLAQRTGRGAIARAVRRRLKGTRDQLAAAMASSHGDNKGPGPLPSELEAMQAALERVHTSHRLWRLGEPLEFTLHVPEMSDVLQRLADLKEEIRVNDSLALHTQARRRTRSCHRPARALHPLHPCTLAPHPFPCPRRRTSARCTSRSSPSSRLPSSSRAGWGGRSRRSRPPSACAGCRRA